MVVALGVEEHEAEKASSINRNTIPHMIDAC
jgi:hypothetical protein